MDVIYTPRFAKDVRKVKDSALVMRISGAIVRLSRQPERGKPLRYALAGKRSIRIPPCRLIYELRGKTIVLHCIEHRKGAYR